MERFRRTVLTGLLTLMPIWITVWLMWFVLDFLTWSGRPFVLGLARAVRPQVPGLADLLTAPWFQSALALVVAIGLLYALGAATKVMVGRRLLRLVDRTMESLPLARTIYTATRTLIASIRKGQPDGRRVVLIEFPTPEMRAVGFVTATFRAADTGQEVAAGYVPTTPNPTSGYVEIVPTERLVWLDWTTNDAMAFIVSGGAFTPREIRMRPGSPSGRPLPAAPDPA